MKKALFIFLGIIVFGAALYIGLNIPNKNVVSESSQSQQPQTPSKTEEVVNREQAITVTAKDGKFSPDTFKIELFDTVNLTVTAVDRDYSFKVAGYPRLDTTIPRGKTATVRIQYLGVGDYDFTCGIGCTGKLMVVQERDTEGEAD